MEGSAAQLDLVGESAADKAGRLWREYVDNMHQPRPVKFRVPLYAKKMNKGARARQLIFQQAGMSTDQPDDHHALVATCLWGFANNDDDIDQWDVHLTLQAMVANLLASPKKSKQRKARRVARWLARNHVDRASTPEWAREQRRHAYNHAKEHFRTMYE